MKSLVLTLGHNSSAILVENGVPVCGYEEERFSLRKADSNFPRQAIKEIMSFYKLPKDIPVYVGHWFPDGELPKESNKYWDVEFMFEHFPNAEIHSVDMDYTHHDSHADSVEAFSNVKPSDDYVVMVVDGFGTAGEVISVYQNKNGLRKVIKRIRGYNKSMGLLYQYATDYCGMIMHNHEYKMLAYEVHINEVLDVVKKAKLKGLIAERATEILKECYDDSINSTYDPLINPEALTVTKLEVHKMLDSVMRELLPEDASTRDIRIVTSYFTQGVVEQVISTLYKLYCGSGDVLVAGGVFYNVKLNHILANMTQGKFTVIPLTGDQGAGLGLYHRYNGILVLDNLCIGKRILHSQTYENLRTFSDETEFWDAVKTELRTVGIVNIVRGDMEFGPRALCNTSTLALPTLDNAAEINRINDRTNEMPFAPVMSDKSAEKFLKDLGKVNRSLNFMICNREYNNELIHLVRGAAHYYPDDDIYTGRPQIVTRDSDPGLYSVLEAFGPLINTSFNYHGVPIVRDMDQIMYTHMKQQENNSKVKTLILENC